jgi:membrane-bound inhibitor of C-type lysozyme
MIVCNHQKPFISSLFLVLFLVLSLTGCSSHKPIHVDNLDEILKNKGTRIKEEVALSDIDVHKERLSYACENGFAVIAIYYGQPDHALADLQVNDRYFSLYAVPSASGAKYATEQGLEEGAGLIWWVKGDEAMVIEMTLDHTVTPNQYPVITTCSLI